LVKEDIQLAHLLIAHPVLAAGTAPLLTIIHGVILWASLTNHLHFLKAGHRTYLLSVQPGGSIAQAAADQQMGMKKGPL